MKRIWLLHVAVLLTILCLAFSPVVSVAIAGEIAQANGCQLDEGSIHPCLINGVDYGDTLYTMGVLGWLMLATIPLGLAAAGLYLLVVVAIYLIRRLSRRKRSETPAGEQP